MKILLHKFAVLFLGLMMLCAPFPAPAADEATEAEYEARVSKADPAKNPAAHKTLAEWCKRRFPGKYQFHLEAWNLYEFGRAERLLPASPSLVELRRTSELAAKMGLKKQAEDYRGRWGGAQFSVFAKKIPAGNSVMMKQLLDWAVKEKVEFIAPCQEMAAALIALEPEHLPARRILKHLKLSAGWKSWEEALASIDLQHAPDRLEIHKAAAEYRIKKEPADYPRDPLRDMKPLRENVHQTATRTGNAPYFVWTKNYRREQPCALVIGLHGGGAGGLEKSLEDAPREAIQWNRHVTGGSWVVICPTVRNHVANSWWNGENLEDVFDMIEETVERFNIDRKRIYVTGTSMGGNGAGLWLWAFPELSAASCARAGAYWHTMAIRDVLGKPILVIHGEKDEKHRNDSRDEYIRKTESYGGKVTHISYPEQDHFLKSETIFPHMIPFFEKHVNDIEPDFRLLREVFRDRHKKYPGSGG